MAIKANGNTKAAPKDIYSTDFELPAIVRGGGGRSSEDADRMRGMKLITKGNPQSFFVPGADAPAAVTDPAERDKAMKDNVRKLSSKMSGLARRLVDKDATLNFAVRTMTHEGRLGVRVFRIAPETAA